MTGVLARLDRGYGLARHADPHRQLALGHLAVLEAQAPDVVVDLRRHGSAAAPEHDDLGDGHRHGRDHHHQQGEVTG